MISKVFTIKDIFRNLDDPFFSEDLLIISGWVKSIRKQKTKIFISINDGSTLNNLQLVVSDQNSLVLSQANEVSYADALMILVFLKRRDKNSEIDEKEVFIREFLSINKAIDFPFPKKRIPLPVLRNFPFLRSRTNYFLYLTRLENFVFEQINSFLKQKGFLRIHAPIITSNDAEGAGASFILKEENKDNLFFSIPSQLTVSAQLHLEALCQGFGKVFSFIPCFRAEKSETSRHLAEFLMLEVEEVISLSEKGIISLVEDLIKFIFQQLLLEQEKTIAFFENYNQIELKKKIKNFSQKEFKRIEYKEAKELLEFNGFSNVGLDLQAEHERFLCEHFYSPVFVLNFPEEIKAFYVKSLLENNKTSSEAKSFDLLFPEIGELVGGSLREDNFFLLKKKMKEKNIQNLDWYLNLRKFGYLPTAGFGLGYERLLMFITGTGNIKDVRSFFSCFRNLIC